MENFSFKISVEYKHDLDKIVNLLEVRDLKFEQFKYSDQSGYSLEFESDYGEYEIINDMELTFNNYTCYKGLGLGRVDVKIHIIKYQSPINTDKWGCLLSKEVIEENIYFGFSDKRELFDFRLKQVSHMDKTGFLGVIYVKNIETNIVGFLTYAFPPRTSVKIELKDYEKLSDKLFQTEDEALKEGETLLKNYFEKLVNDDSEE